MVTAPHALAAQGGLQMLAAGGNAADAAIATAAALSVVYPHMTGLGGDAFWLYYDAKTGDVSAYNGSGAAAQLATMDHYQAREAHAVPETGALAALTVPGAVDAWFALHERFGSFSMERLLAAAVRYAVDGAPVARSLHGALQQKRDQLLRDEGAASLYACERVAPIGSRLRQPQLGASLRSIAQFGRAWFYEGEGAERIGRYCERIGSPLRAADFAAHAGLSCSPAAGTFLGCDSLTMPPNSQGITLLAAQAIYERHRGAHQAEGGAARGSVDDDVSALHAAIESIRLAFETRDEYVRDPRMAADWREALASERIAALAARIDRDVAAPSSDERADRGDTTYFACTDGDGNAVSFIQSLFHGFGAAVAVPELGIVLNNRGSAFQLSPGHRSLSPGVRPFHTLMPCMLMSDGKPWLVYGSMGGEGQPQTALLLSIRIAQEGMDVQAAIEAPRFRYGKTWIEEPARLNLEARFDPASIAGLRARGHAVNVLGDWEESMGHAGAILFERACGFMSGGADPRGDGAAVGF
ncbi:MAG: gamma-glutamyltransferase family protein [Candidatus Eremiobacter antarcticus]|nr:gamma-glutamyltransferase family protein [Candidatus Eremiobacteraeota bacterium]MBC5809131.1 gamma-glutamyltransferase family protein [Candidatus Eremiobacteraeota bacterium]